MPLSQVCDFGLSRFKANTFIPSKSVAGTVSSLKDLITEDMLQVEKNVLTCETSLSLSLSLWSVFNSLSGWLQSFLEVSRQTRNQMFTASEWSYGS